MACVPCTTGDITALIVPRTTVGKNITHKPMATDGERPQEREHVDRLRAGQCLPYPVSHVKERTQAGDTFRHPDHVAA